MSERRSARAGAFEKALAFCREQRLFRPGARVLVGSCSGPASLGLLGFLRLAEQELKLGAVAVASVDAGGEDDPDSVADTGRFARQLHADFHAVSSEGRTATEALRAVAREHGFDRVALGHTRDDAVARLFAQLVDPKRGLRSLRPLVARRRDGIVRPLLSLRESEAVELARAAGIEPVQLAPEPHVRPSLDERLRRAVLPRLRVEAPGVDEALLRLGREVRALNRLTERQARARVMVSEGDASTLSVAVMPGESGPAHATARAVLTRLCPEETLQPGATVALAKMLCVADRALTSRERVLGPGVVATYHPDRRTVTVRLIRPRRPQEERIG